MDEAGHIARKATDEIEAACQAKKLIWSLGSGKAKDMADIIFAKHLYAYGEACRRAGAKAMREAAAEIVQNSATFGIGGAAIMAIPLPSAAEAGTIPMIRTALDELKMAATSLAMRAHTVTDENPNARNDERVSVTLGEVRDLANALLAFNAAPLPPAAEAASPAAGWRPIDTGPTDGTYVILFDPDATDEVLEGGYREDMQRWLSRGGRKLSPTHWTSLPSAPSEEATAG